MKAPKHDGQFLGKIYPHSICNRVFKRENRTTQIPENLRRKPGIRKNHGAKREILLMQEDYNGCTEYFANLIILGLIPSTKKGINFYSYGSAN